MLSVETSADGRYLLVAAFRGWSRNALYLCDLRESPGRFLPVTDGLEGLFYGSVHQGYLYILTDLDAPRNRLYRTPVSRPRREDWELIVPEGEGVLQGFSVVSDRLFLNRLQDACSRLSVHSLDGGLLEEAPLPSLGSASTPLGEWNGQEAFFSFASFFTPTAIYRYDISAGGLTLFDQVETDIDESRYQAQQVHYSSKDGARVSMFILHQRGLALDGANPTMLTGYGGFNTNLVPAFQRTSLFWLEQGGVIAIPNLRGGGEYGETWHQAGVLGAKQNVFDDFIAAAEWLIEQGYTSPGRLAISGASNGGLLVAAALTQRPDLFAAVHCGVPLLDMLRYHRFSIARLWIPEYGSADDPEQFEWLYAYSPYNHVTVGEHYPAVLLTTAEDDSRVHPMHALKMAALLQYASGSDRPALLWVEPQAGHGAGKPLGKAVQEWTDIFSFFCWQLGVAA